MTPLQMAIREIAFKKIRGVFKKHGASEIDTPVFELKETLTSKYGEDSKLIYDLEDQGGELLSLRYDLTVPFARYVAERGLSSIKRFHIAKVYRRDTPQMNKGRFREFYQCDFDIAGTYGLMIPDADLLSVVVDILKSLEIGSFVIKLNHRKFLDAMIQLAGCEQRKFKAICSSIDKLDKEPWSAVRDELLNQKGLTEEMCLKLEKFVQYKGSPWEMLNRLKDEKVFEGHKSGEDTIKEMETLFTYLEAMNLLEHISFDFSLARGLDYYTGVIYEAVLTDTDRVGSISGGGRYDGLIGMFSGKVVPSVGGSIGIERIFNILEEKMLAKGEVRATETQVLVSQMGKNLTAKRMETLSLLWKHDIKAETLYVDNPRTDKTFSYAFDNGIPLILIIGEQEIKDGIYKIKSLNENKEHEVKAADLVSKV
jgi:histidyl-tRNA synthetase